MNLLNFSLLWLSHDASILYEGLIAFGRLNCQMEDKAQTANARTEVAKKLLHAAEKWEKSRFDEGDEVRACVVDCFVAGVACEQLQ